MKAASKVGRHGHRDSTLILVTYGHGIRVSELFALDWNQAELDGGRMHVSRSKDGSPSVHLIRGPEIRALRRLKRDYPESPSPGALPVSLSNLRSFKSRRCRNLDFFAKDVEEPSQCINGYPRDLSR